MTSNVVAMLTTKPIDFALLVKNGRRQKNCTQRELSEATGISLRSIQRIENGTVKPRAYTVRVLSVYLELEENAAQRSVATAQRNNLPLKIILSIGIALLLMVIAIAYVFQSVSFPETAFELTVYIGIFLLLYLIFLFKIWR